LLENQRILALDTTLKETPVRWWGAHKVTIKDWYQCKKLLCIRFGTEQESNQLQRCDGHGTPIEHLEELKNTMDNDTTRRMASPLYSHIGRNSTN
jgi:hypothetical protein